MLLVYAVVRLVHRRLFRGIFQVVVALTKTNSAIAEFLFCELLIELAPEIIKSPQDLLPIFRCNIHRFEFGFVQELLGAVRENQ